MSVPYHIISYTQCRMHIIAICTRHSNGVCLVERIEIAPKTIWCESMLFKFSGSVIRNVTISKAISRLNITKYKNVRWATNREKKKTTFSSLLFMHYSVYWIGFSFSFFLGRFVPFLITSTRLSLRLDIECLIDDCKFHAWKEFFVANFFLF